MHCLRSEQEELRKPAGDLDCLVISHGIRRERLEGWGCRPVSRVFAKHTLGWF